MHNIDRPNIKIYNKQKNWQHANRLSLLDKPRLMKKVKRLLYLCQK